MKYFQANCQILIEAAKNCTLVLSMRVNINIKLLTKEKIKQVMTRKSQEHVRLGSFFS